MKFKYKSADKSITWNEDKDLKPITFQLPEPPDLETIEGYGLPPEDQFWVHKPMPPKLAKINSLTHTEDGKVALTPRMKMEMLERNQEFYHDEILWIEREWERRENGYWFFNNGKPTMITGDHYFYLRYWPIEGQLPDYRNRDRRWFWFWTMVENDDNCFGFNNPKQRREGATIKVCSIRWGRASMHPYFNTGLQSKDEDHASTVHYSEIVEVSKAVPFFFQPITDNAQNVWREIRFFSPTSKVHPDYGYSALNSFIDYKDSGPKAYDGLKKRLIHNDESGKCLGFNTLVLMYGGSYKPVQDITVGDQLMGLDSTPRTVQRIFRGEDEMYRVIPNKGDSWTCNGEHILTTKSASDHSIFNASVNEYLRLDQTKRDDMMLYYGGVSNPLHAGFKVVPEGRGNYYGFEIDKDHLFMLHDFTVVHNCSIDIDINERVRIQIPCLTNIVRNSPVKGKLINTSTTGQMESGGGGRFKLLCDASDFHKRNDNGLTMSGLYTLFQSAREGMEGIDPKTNQPFIDKYGEANEEAIQRYLTAKREALRKAGRVADYIEECRQYPLEYADSWKTSARNCVFNLMKIEDRLEFYRNGNPDKVQGNFEWSSGPDSKVRFVPSEVGRFYLSLQLDPNKANRMIVDPDGRKTPGNPNKFYAGGDPFKFSKTKNKGSYGGGAVYWKYDHAVDAGKPDYMKHDSNRFVCTYKYRPITIEDYGEDMIKMCVYFGCTMFPETNVDFLYKYFEDRGYGGYLYYIFDPRKGRFASMPGQYTHVKEKEQIFSVTQSYIERHALRERHDELLREWKEIVDELNDFDLAVAAGLALIAAGDIDEGAYEEEDTSATDIDTYYQRFKY